MNQRLRKYYFIVFILLIKLCIFDNKQINLKLTNSVGQNVNNIYNELHF